MRARQIEDFYPLSPMQQAMLMYHLARPDGGGFQQASGVIRSRLDVERLRQAWQRTVDRYPMLRTSFLWDGVKEPVQMVHAAVPFELAYRDIQSLSPALREDEFAAIREADRRRGFDLQKPPLIRLVLVREEPDVCRFVWSYHHILLDGWSLGLVLQDVFEGYGLAEMDAAVERPAPPSYRDYIVWLRRQDWTASPAYWQRILADYTPPPLRAASLNDAPPHEHERTLSADVAAGLRGTARTQHVTLNTIVQACWGVVAAAALGRDDVVFGTTVSGRSPLVPGIDAIVGLCMNNVPVRVTVPAGDVPFIAWLRTAQSAQADFREHECCSLAQIHGWCGRRAPFFDTLLVLENYALDGRLLAQRQTFGFEMTSGTIRTAYPMTVVVVPRETWRLRLVVHATVPENEAEEWLTAFERVLQLCASTPETPLGRFTAVAAGSLASPTLPIVAVPRPFTTTTAAPRTVSELELTDFLEEFFDTGPIGPRDHLLGLVRDSLTMIQLLARFQARFGSTPPLHELLEEPTVERLARLLAGTGESASPLVKLVPATDTPPLFCVHPAAGTVLGYLNVARRIADVQPVVGLQCRGLNETTPRYRGIDEMAADYVDVVCSAQPHGSYWLGGWSMGGTIAFEMARQMEASGLDVARVVLFDTRPPGAFQDLPDVVGRERRLMAGFALATLFYGGQRPAFRLSDVEQRSEEEYWRFIVDELRRSSVLPAEIPEREVRRLYDVWRNNLRAVQRYDPPSHVRAPLTVMRAREAPPAELAAWLSEGAEDRSALDNWTRYSLNPIEWVAVPGSHYTMFNEPNAASLAKTLVECLARARAGVSAGP